MAQNYLGYMYCQGQGVQQDYQQAVQWYRKAAEQGDAQAQNNLGILYDNGQGVTKDDQQAKQWYQKAAEQGDARGQYGLGAMYANGLGVKKDYQQARLWLQKAADQGHADAQTILERLYEAPKKESPILSKKRFTTSGGLYEAPKKESPIFQESYIDKLYKAAIGDGADYYLDIFKQFDKQFDKQLDLGDISALASWNWAAFLLGPFWLLSRNMVLNGVLYLLCLLILLGIFSMEAVYLSVPVIFFNVFLSWFGNALYYFHIRRKIDKAAVLTDGTVRAQIDALKNNGSSLGSIADRNISYINTSTERQEIGMPGAGRISLQAIIAFSVIDPDFLGIWNA